MLSWTCFSPFGVDWLFFVWCWWRWTVFDDRTPVIIVIWMRVASVVEKDINRNYQYHQKNHLLSKVPIIIKSTNYHQNMWLPWLAASLWPVCVVGHQSLVIPHLFIKRELRTENLWSLNLPLPARGNRVGAQPWVELGGDLVFLISKSNIWVTDT